MLPVNAIIETTNYKPQLWKRRNARQGDLRRGRGRNGLDQRMNRRMDSRHEDMIELNPISEQEEEEIEELKE